METTVKSSSKKYKAAKVTNPSPSFPQPDHWSNTSSEIRTHKPEAKHNPLTQPAFAMNMFLIYATNVCIMPTVHASRTPLKKNEGE